MMSVLGDARVSQISIVDSSINIAKKLADISAQGEKVISVAQTGATSALIINAEEYVASTIALEKISNAYTIGIKGATVNQLANFTANEKVRSITVTDSSENIATNINLIQSQSSKITQVSLTDDQKILNLSSDDFLNNGTTLRKIITPYKVNVVGVSLANLNSVATYKNVGSIHITDDSVNIASRLTDITRVSNKISSITQIGSPNTMQLNASQYLSSSPVLAKIQNPYTVNLTGVKTANLVAIAADNTDLPAEANGLHTLKMSAGDIGDVPLERGLVAVGPGSGSAADPKERIYVAYRALSIESVTVSAKRDAASMFEVSFRLLPDDNSGSYGKIVDRTVGTSGPA
jgi:hypothetical protein